MGEIRYSRLESIDGIGPDGVRKINAGKVLVIGCGALGSLCSMYLAASGVGVIGIVDFDTIDISNLQRQLFFCESALGKSKLKILAQRIRGINSTVELREYEEFLTEKKAREYFPGYDVIIDGSDNPSTKSMTSRICEELGLPYIIGGVKDLIGQVMSWLPGHAGYHEIFGDVNTCTGITPCSTGGVLGPAAGIVASVQAAEALKHLSGFGELLTDRLFHIDLSKPYTAILQV